MDFESRRIVFIFVLIFFLSQINISNEINRSDHLMMDYLNEDGNKLGNVENELAYTFQKAAAPAIDKY